MTKFDIRNYFEKIYGIEVAAVHTRIQKGKCSIIIICTIHCSICIIHSYYVYDMATTEIIRVQYHTVYDTFSPV